jgi:hypothetical protein
MYLLNVYILLSYVLRLTNSTVLLQTSDLAETVVHQEHNS